MIGLSTQNIQGIVHSKMSDSNIEKFIRANNFNAKSRTILLNAIKEARHNQFGLFVINADDNKNQTKILSEFIDF